MSGRLVIRIAAAPAESPVRWLAAEAPSESGGFGRVDRLEQLPPELAQQARRVALIVPGTQVLCRRVDLPARTETQARAAAGSLMEDYLACAPEAMHFALARPGPENLRSVFAVEDAAMRAWLSRLAELGLEPDLVVPDYLLLGARTGEAVLLDEETTVTAALGPGEGFTAESELARLALPEALARAEIGALTLVSDSPERLTPPDGWGDVAVSQALPPSEETRLAEMAARLEGAAVNLRQGPFARQRGLAGTSRRGLAALAAALALVAVLAAMLLYLEGARYARLAEEADARAARVFRSVAGESERVVNPVQQLSAKRAALSGKSGGGFLELASMLSAAVASVDGVRVQSLSYAGENASLNARLAYRAFDDLDPIKEAVAARGGRLTETGARQDNGTVRGTVTVEMAE